MRPPLVRNLVGRNGEGGELSSAIDLASSLNYIMNSNFDIAQRGSSFSNPGADAYLLDRWQIGYDGSGQTFTVSQTAIAPGALPTSASNCMEISQTVAPTGQTSNVMVYHIEDVNTLQGKTVTFGFYAAADQARSIGLQFVQSFGAGGSADVILPLITFTAVPDGPFAGGFSYFEFQIEIPSVAGKTIGLNSIIYFYFAMPINDTFNFFVTSLMLNEGSVAAPHVLMGRTFGGELALCHRYCWSPTWNSITFGGGLMPCFGINNDFIAFGNFPVAMRAGPSFNQSIFYIDFTPMTGPSVPLNTFTGDVRTTPYGYWISGTLQSSLSPSPVCGVLTALNNLATIIFSAEF